jgi:hypothetical protein
MVLSLRRLTQNAEGVRILIVERERFRGHWFEALLATKWSIFSSIRGPPSQLRDLWTE